jgi:hypothetical protein
MELADAAGGARADVVGTGGATHTDDPPPGAGGDLADSGAGGAPAGDSGAGSGAEDAGAGGRQATKDSGAGGALPKPTSHDACKPPSAAGQDCDSACGWTADSAPSGYPASGQFKCDSYESCASTVVDTYADDESLVLPSQPQQREVNGAPSVCAPLANCGGSTPDLLFNVGYRQCVRFTSSSSARQFSTDISGKCERSACLVVTGPTVDHAPSTAVTVLTAPIADPAWVRYEAVKLAADDSCPLACP